MLQNKIEIPIQNDGDAKLNINYDIKNGTINLSVTD